MSAPLTPAVRRALKRIPVLLEADGYATETTLMRELGIDYSGLRTAVGVLYRQRRADRVLGYIVPPPHPGEFTAVRPAA